MRIFLLALLALLSLSCQRSPQVNTQSLKSEDDMGVIGGATASQNEFKFVVNIWQNSPRDNFVDHLCGGSLIAEKWVLTAAHCMLDESSEDTQRPLKVQDLDLIIGSNHISGRGGRHLKAKRIVIHPQFSWPLHDVALIELVEMVTDIAPVLLNKKDLDAVASSTQATVMGWGLIDAQGKVDGEFLQKTTLQLVSRKMCRDDSFPIQKRYKIGTETLCALTAQNQRASCPGDSGGPLVMTSGAQFIQVGIVSWGSACGGERSKNNSNVEGYADVADALSWIQKVTGI